jgi:hypothetical protein
VIMPIGLRFQKELELAPGMIATDAVDEILLVCRRDPGAIPAAVADAGSRRYLRPLPAKAAVTPRPMNTPPVT